ncbi:lipid II flippase MurJ [Longispora fulva]|uniref:Putative peptidoglycan lipid II flippase n=1 Tax=Longispora fulva TaxID=619741 RepID=A0A8J7GML2_9ACTN|nr:murein biosynthesis integral membrane protein MurJ [Longispora fulva]MBG6139643.1 putative peptidoglycan lipid II flippase [Longispora fulva]GIG57975.1 lipid II flippase MurJ [Longispora fulva]
MRQPDPDATVILPIVPEADPDATQLLAVVPAEAPQPARSGAPAAEEKSIGRSSAGMALGSLVSRGTGFLRTLLVTAALGSAVGDAYTNATLFPGMVYELLLGGVLSSVLVPLLVRARDSDDDRGEKYTQRLLTAAVLFLGLATLLAVAAAPLLARIVANGAQLDLTTTWAYMVLPTIFFYGLAALFAAVLNTRGHFAAPMWAPILNNLVLCGAAGLVLVMTTAKPTLADTPTGTVWIIGLGTASGIVLQAVSLIPALRKVGFRWAWRFDFRALRLREIARLGGWMVCYVAVSQVAVFAIAKLASYASDKHEPGILIYNNVYLLMMMAHGIVAVSILTALMPRLSAAAAAGRNHEVVDYLAKGTRLVVVLLAPISVIYMVLNVPIGVTLFKAGNFEQADALSTGIVTAAAAFALIPFAVSQLQTFAFYSLPDTRTPALINIPVVAVRIGVDVLWWLLFSLSSLAAGLMFGNALSFLAAVGLSGLLLRRRLGPLGLRAIGITVAKVAGAALVATAAGYAVTLPFDPETGGKVYNALVLVLGSAVIGLVYLGVAHLLRIAEVTEAIGMVKRKLGR